MNRNHKSAIAARIDLVASERGLPDSEVRAAKQRDDALIDFAYRQDLSFDWLILGDNRAGKNLTPEENKARIKRLLQLVR
jgi:hypothetical protein